MTSQIMSKQDNLVPSPTKDFQNSKKLFFTIVKAYFKEFYSYKISANICF